MAWAWIGVIADLYGIGICNIYTHTQRMHTRTQSHCQNFILGSGLQTAFQSSRVTTELHSNFTGNRGISC